jgi:hypothetical protein
LPPPGQFPNPGTHRLCESRGRPGDPARAEWVSVPRRIEIRAATLWIKWPGTGLPARTHHNGDVPLNPCAYCTTRGITGRSQAITRNYGNGFAVGGLSLSHQGAHSRHLHRRHAGAGRHPVPLRGPVPPHWIPAFAGMTAERDEELTSRASQVSRPSGMTERCI